MQREFIRHGKHHWSLNGESPCKAQPVPENMVYAVLTAFGHRERVSAFAEPCEVCMPTKTAFQKFQQHGGVWYGPWDIRPFEPRGG